MKLYLLLEDITTSHRFKKYFESEYAMDKFIRKLKYSHKLIIIYDSREDYFIDYER